MTELSLIDNRYMIGGVSLTDLAQEFGTPLYVYHAEKIIKQYNRLKQAFSGADVKIKYALKALNNIHILRLLKEQGSGLDAVSIYEVGLGLKAGFTPEDILFTPNCVSIQEIQMAVDAGVKINIDNLSILEQFGNIYGSSVPVCVRINPHIMAGGHHKISTGHIDSKFGISIYQMRHLHRIIKNYGLHITGLHMHTGSDILDAQVFLQGAELMFEVIPEFPELQFIDFGSGFKVSYQEGDVTTNVEDLGQQLCARFDKVCTTYGRPLELWFEPGKFLVSEAGYLLVSTNVIKQTTATIFAGVDSGQNHLIRPMLYDAYHHITNISNPQGTTRIYSVVGNICETDTFGWDRKLNEVREGDILCFSNAGAYGYTMSSNYNARPRPAEVLIQEGNAKLIRRRETLDDMLATIVK
jgi:diaminopimelate decarboxylase